MIRLRAALCGLYSVVALSGCAVRDDGYGYGGGYGYPGAYEYNGNLAVGADYYEPYDSDYGGWGPGYEVGPFRDGRYGRDGGRDDRGDGYGRGGGRGGQYAGRGGGTATHAFRPAAAGRAMPSIPSGSRGGGGGGGGHGGGGGGHGGGGHGSGGGRGGGR